MEEWKEYSGKTVDDAFYDALEELGVTSDQVEMEVLERESSGFIGLFKKEAKIRVKKIETRDDVATFLKKVINQMGVDGEIILKKEEEENVLSIEIKGDNLGILIGKRGQTLDALQYLCSLVVNRDAETYTKVKLDTENYRERRKATLENLARNVAAKVKRTQHSVTLEPMNPYERRIIHAALQEDKYVETHSEGEEPNRCVVVTLSKEYAEYSAKHNNYNNGRRSYGGRHNNNRRGSGKPRRDEHMNAHNDGEIEKDRKENKKGENNSKEDK